MDAGATRKVAPRRVLMTADTIGGVWTFALELAEGLSRAGAQVRLATLGRVPSPDQRSEALAIPGLTLRESEYKLEWMEDPWRDVAASGRWLLEMEREWKPDLVHLNSFGHAALPWRAPTVLTAHSCVASWWQAVKREPLPAEWRRYYEMVRRSLHAADVIVAPSHAMSGNVLRCYGAEARVIPNGRSRSRFRIEEKQPFVFAAGRLWDAAKNVSALVEAAPGMAWPVILAGESQDSGPLSSREMASHYARAAIFVSPARYEPFGLAVLEAAMSGCALVLADIDSFRENWDGAAMFVSLDSRRSVAEAINALIEHPVRRHDLARRAFERSRNFGQERMVSGYLSAYRSAMERNYACVS